MTPRGLYWLTTNKFALLKDYAATSQEKGDNKRKAAEKEARNMLFDFQASLQINWIMMMIAFITFKSSLVPLFEGLWRSNS